MKLPHSTTLSPESACSANCQTSDSALTINTHEHKHTARYYDPTATFEQEEVPLKDIPPLEGGIKGGVKTVGATRWVALFISLL